jgi:hypothetical protein
MSEEIQPGVYVKFKVKAVTNNRLWRAVGKVLSVHGPICVVRYSRPWSHQMQEDPFKTADLKIFRPRNPITHGL